MKWCFNNITGCKYKTNSQNNDFKIRSYNYVSSNESNKFLKIIDSESNITINNKNQNNNNFNEKPKIICLHGGNGSAEMMKYMCKDLIDFLPEFEFLFVSISGNKNKKGNWWDDPPNGKSNPTTNRNHASKMISVINNYIVNQGPFYGIIGYSQGAAAIPVILSQIPIGTFKIAISFSGYLPTTHLGLIEIINEAAPINGVKTLSYMSINDFIIPVQLSKKHSKVFKNNQVLIDDDKNSGHFIPNKNNKLFFKIIDFIKLNN